MICPQTKLECVKPQVCNAGRLCAPPPDWAEIERLAGDVSLALSALLAAVRKLEK